MSSRRARQSTKAGEGRSDLATNLTQIPKFRIVLVLDALGFRDRKETDVLQLIYSVSLIAKRSGFSRTRTTTNTRTTPQLRNLGLILIVLIWICLRSARPL